MKIIAERIRERIRRTTTDIIATGHDLLGVKSKLDHGAFHSWIETEFGINARTAQNYMRAATWAEGKSELVSHLPPSTVYLLAAPSTPEEFTTEVLSNIESGCPVDHHQVRARIKMARVEQRIRDREISRRRERRRRRSPARLKREEADHRRRQAEKEAQMIEADRLIDWLRKKLSPEDFTYLHTAMMTKINTFDFNTAMRKAGSEQ
ncbi:MAG: hypothetical protein IIA72_20775 [Proteobacteria bacterium]|nr:hypothetical protein [Pseudomonadota bacterium]